MKSSQEQPKSLPILGSKHVRVHHIKLYVSSKNVNAWRYHECFVLRVFLILLKGGKYRSGGRASS